MKLSSKPLLLAAGGAGAAAGIATTLTRSRSIDAASAARREAEGGRPLPVNGSDGTALHARVHGPPDAATIVLSHCWTGTQELWHRQIAALDEEFRIVVYDQRGHGRSAAARDGGYTLEALASDLDAVLDAALRPGERALLAGHSLGGMTIASWAERNRGAVAERVAGVALLSTGMDSLSSEATVVRVLPGPFDTVRGRISDGVLEAPLTVRTIPIPIARAAVRYVALGPDARDEDVELTLRMLYDCRPRARAGCGRAMMRMENRAALSALDVPAVVITGCRDRMTPPRQSERIVEGLPEATLVTDERAGHMTPLESAELVNQTLRELAVRVALQAPAAAVA